MIHGARAPATPGITAADTSEPMSKWPGCSGSGTPLTSPPSITEVPYSNSEKLAPYVAARLSPIHQRPRPEPSRQESAKPCRGAYADNGPVRPCCDNLRSSNSLECGVMRLTDWTHLHRHSDDEAHDTQAGSSPSVPSPSCDSLVTPSHPGKRALITKTDPELHGCEDTTTKHLDPARI